MKQERHSKRTFQFESVTATSRSDEGRKLMKRMHSAATAVLLTLIAGCAEQEPAASSSSSSAIPSAPVRVELDRATSALDLGKSGPGEKPAELKTKLEALLAGDISADERDDALFLVSRAAELSGDRERAISALEQLLAAHAGQLPDRLERAPKRLETLLVGHELKSVRGDEERIAPVADAMAKYFPLEKGKTTEVLIVRIDPTNNGVDEAGIYNIGGALRKEAERSCPTCESPSIHTSSHGTNRWSGIPAQQKNMKRALTIVAMDLGDYKLPERYAAYSALPLAEVEARLATGQGLIAVKERADAPPIILMAAPRVGQLALVAEAFQKLDALPKEPMSVPLPKNMSSGEVRTTIREAKRTFAGCYENLLKRDAAASGKIVLQLTVDGQGGVTQATMGDGTTMSEPTFVACEIDAMRALHFPKVGAETTIRYPLTFTP